MKLIRSNDAGMTCRHQYLREDEELSTAEPIDPVEANPVEESPAESTLPTVGPAYGISAMLTDTIQKMWDNVQRFNDMLLALQDAGESKAIEIVKVINNDTHQHIGELQEILKTFSPSATEVDVGSENAEEFLSASAGQDPIVVDFSTPDDDISGDELKGMGIFL